MVAALPWKAGLYDLEVVSPQGHYFQTVGLVYDIGSRNASFLQSKLSSMKDVCVLSLKISGKLYTILLILLRCMKLIFMS